MQRKRLLTAFALVLGTLIASTILAFPFWLEAPAGRTNQWDRANPNSNWALAPLVPPTYTITPTFTVSPTISPTFSDTPNWTATVSPTYTASPTPSPSVTPGPASVLFEDFDSTGTLATPGDYNDGTSVVNNYNVSSVQAYSGANSWVLDVNTSGGSWGAGMNIQSNYGMIDASNADTIEFQIWTPNDLNFSVRFREKGLAVDSNENENWLSPNQNVTGTGAWQTISIPISSFVEDGYGNPGCGPNCGISVGDNTMQLDQIFMFELQFAGGTNPLTTLYVDDVRFLVPVGPTATPTNTPVTTALLWEDFDLAGTLLNPVDFNDGVSTVSNYTISTAQATSGTNSWILDVNSVGGSWGCGIHLESNHGALDATGASIMRFKIYTTSTVTFSARFRENGIDDGTAATDENENWAAPNKTVTGMAGWQTVTLPLSSFSENAYGNVRTGGNSGTVGNNTMDLNQIFEFEFQFATELTAAPVYIDDIEYLVPAPTPTPTPCPSCSTSGTFGDNTVGGFQNAVNGYMESAKFNFASGGIVMSMAIWTNAVVGDMQMSIYKDNAGAPTTRMGYTAVFTPAANSWNTVALTAPLCLPAGNYYLAFTRSGATSVNFTIDGSNPAPQSSVSQVPGTPPANYPALWSAGDIQRWSIYANYCP